MAEREKSWSELLRAYVKGKPVVVLRFGEAELEALQESRRGVREFTKAFPHADFSHVKAPTLCLLLAETDEGQHAYLGLIGSRSPITTLQSRVKIKRAVRIEPATPQSLVDLLDSQAHKGMLRKRLATGEGLTVLSPKLSGELIDRLASIEANAGSMRSLATSLALPRKFRGNGALQEDAIRTAMKAFGLGPDDRADSLELVPDRETALVRVPIIEDGVIEQDARSMPGTISSEVT